MITKNAEDFLWYTMKSTYDFVDDIIIIDDQSTDTTLDIVNSFPKEKITLVCGKYEGDKRRQRNEYLKKAKGSWIFVQDDDEVYASNQLEWLRKFIQSGDAVKYNEIFFRMLWFWHDGQHVIHGHHWDQRFEVFYRNIPGLVYDIHHAVSLNGKLLCKGPSYLTDVVTIYHYSHCKSDKKIREKIKYYMMRDNPNVDLKNVNSFVNKHPHFSGNFDQPRYGSQGLQIAGTVGSQRDIVVKYDGKHPGIMEGHPLVMKKQGLEEYKKGMNLYMESHWQFHNHLHYPRHTNRIQYTAEFLKGRSVEIGCANGFSTNIMKKHLGSLGRTDVVLEGVEPTDWGYTQAVKNYPDIEFTKSMGEELPFKDQEFTTVLLAEVIEHVLNPEVFFKECVRVCKIGGRVIVTTPNGPHDDPDHRRAYYPASLSKLMAPYCKESPRIYGLTIDGKQCDDMRSLYFMVAIGRLG